MPVSRPKLAIAAIISPVEMTVANNPKLAGLSKILGAKRKKSPPMTALIIVPITTIDVSLPVSVAKRLFRYVNICLRVYNLNTSQTSQMSYS